ncbi:transketolase family protein [bacterium]|nr:transketolase family protein [bacterium]
MLDFTKKFSVRSAFGEALCEAARENKDIVVLDADLACSTQTKLFAKEFPDRFFDVGIAEQDMIATAAGLASEGKIPFAASFAVFATGRTYDQIRNSVCYPKFNVKIVGTHGGVTVGEDGASHEALEDIGLMRGLPNMTVIVPADCTECREAVKFAADYKGPVYIRVPRGNLPNIFDENYKFDSKANVLKQGKDLTVFTNGETLCEVIRSGEILKDKGIDIEIVNVPVVKPLDKETVLMSAKKTGLVVTVENHSVINGLGSAICETLSENLPLKVLRIGVNDVFGQSGKSSELLDFYGLTAEKIAEKIENFKGNNND